MSLGPITTIPAQPRQLPDAPEPVEESLLLAASVFENAQEGIIVTDAANNFVAVNPAFTLITGYAAPDVIGRNPRLLGSGRQDAAFYRAMWASLAETGHWHGEIWNRRKNGEIICEWLSVSALKNAEGKTIRHIGIFTDITELKKSREALQESETRFRQLAENIREVFWVRDAINDRILYVSPAYEQIWGRKLVSFDEAYRSFQESIHPDDRTRLFASMERETRVETEHANEYRIVRPDGAVRWVRSRAFPVRDDSGNTYRVVGVAEDITELKHAEEERLAHALKQRDTLVREVHHRVKNNLQAVAGLLMHETYDHPELRPLLRKAIAQVQLIAVVHGIQGAAKAQEMLLCEMVPAIARIVESLTRSRIQIDVNIDMSRPAQICERESVPIALILNELLFNATKHSPRDAQPGKIKVTISRDGNNVEVRIFNPGSLPPGFNFAARIATDTGLDLVGSLMPRQGAKISFRGLSDGVETTLQLSSPVIDV